LLDKLSRICSKGAMAAASEEQRRRDSHLSRLRLLARRLEETQRERVSSIIEASRAGFSIRQIAESAGLSRSRVHQLLQEHAGNGARSS